MSTSWIKMRDSIFTSPRVAIIADAIGADPAVSAKLTISHAGALHELVSRDVTRDVTVCGLMRVWMATNEHTVDGVWHGVTPAAFDAVAQIPGFGAAMQLAGWLHYDEETRTCTLPDFLDYNVPAKASGRSTGAERQKRYRDRQRKQKGNAAQQTQADQGDDRNDCRNSPRNDLRNASRNCDALEVEREVDKEKDYSAPLRGADERPANDGPPGPEHAPPALRADRVPATPKEAIFAVGLPWLENEGVKGARNLLGKLVSEYGEFDLWAAIRSTMNNRPGDPVPYLRKVLQSKARAAPKESLEEKNARVDAEAKAILARSRNNLEAIK